MILDLYILGCIIALIINIVEWGWHPSELLQSVISAILWPLNLIGLWLKYCAR